MADMTPLELAERLAAAAGHEQPQQVVSLPGGRNNRVYRLCMQAGGDLLLKLYFHHPADRRDRLAAEWDFLSHVWALGNRQVPQPLACDREAHAGLYSFLPGRKLAAAEITPGIVALTADFVVSINQGAAPVLSPASEACFSLRQHLETVDRRLERLQQLDPQAPRQDQATALIHNQLLPTWQRVREATMAAASAANISLTEELPGEERCCSPSDFGFHNALMTEAGAIGFLDFEYAGMDDPAKLVCDFFCQPSVPPPAAEFSAFVTRIATGLSLSSQFAERCRILLDVYRIKWLSIMLNDFLPVDAARRIYAGGNDRAARCAEQLAKTENAFARAFADMPPSHSPG